MQPVYMDKHVDVSTVRRWVGQFQQEEVGEASSCEEDRETSDCKSQKLAKQ
jgi:hypothetical protein